MSADVEMLPRQWNKEPIRKSHFDGTNGVTGSSIPVWKRNLMSKKMQQLKNGLLDEASDITESSTIKSVLQRGTMVSYFYPAMEDTSKSIQSITKGDANNENLMSQESGEMGEEKESILPVRQNPILLQDLKRRSKDFANQPSKKSSYWRCSAEEPIAFSADVQEDQVFNDSSKCKEDSDSEEVVYGRGFVHRLLLKFSSLSQKDEKQKHMTSPKATSGGMYDSEPTLVSKPKVKDESCDKISKHDLETEEKAFSDGEERIEPVSNTLCMFEKLFCGRKKSQDDHGVDLKSIDGSTTIPSRKVTQKPSVPRETFINECEMRQSAIDIKHDNVHSCFVEESHSRVKINTKEVETVLKTSLKDSQSKHDEALKTSVKEIDKVGSPVDVKLVKSLFEAISSPHIKLSSSPKDIKINSGKCSPEARDTIQSQISSGPSSTVAVITNDVISCATAADHGMVVTSSSGVAKKNEEQQLRQHKRHSSKDYLEIRQSDKISKDYKQAMESSLDVNTTQTPSSTTLAGAKLITMVARPGKLLIRSSGSGTSVDILSLPKYNDIRTGEFVPASKAYFDDHSEDVDDGDFNFQFDGAGMCLGKSMLAKTRDTKKLKTAFDDNTTITHEYPSEQSLLDWFNDPKFSNHANVVRDAMFFI